MNGKSYQDSAVERRERLSTAEGRQAEAAFTARGKVLQEDDEERRRRGFIGKLIWYWSRRRKELLKQPPT
jgi:hypothetical protein